jgi:DNA-binding MarR family transcriptional regulator
VDESNSTSDERLSSMLWRAARAATRFQQALLTEFDITPRQATAILSLVESPGVTLGTLAEALRADQATASAVVDRLLAAELVKRETDPADRRRARLYPTEKALRMAEAVADARRRTDEMIEDILGRQASKELKRVLNRLSERLEKQAAPVPSGSNG